MLSSSSSSTLSSSLPSLYIPFPAHRHCPNLNLRLSTTIITIAPSDTQKLGVCANVLGGLVNINLSQPPKKPCCSLIEGLADLETAVCLFTAIKAEVLDINLNVPVSLSLLLNYCGKRVPDGYTCDSLLLLIAA